MLDVAFAEPALPEGGALVLPLAEGDLGGPFAGAWDGALGEAVARGAAAAEFTGKKGQATTLYAPGAGLSRLVLLGLGPRGALDARAAEAAGGALVPALARETRAAVDARPLGAHGPDLALGAVLRAWRFDRYRTTQKPEDKPRLAALEMLVEDPGAAREAWGPRRAVAEGVFLARELASEPANVLDPPEFAERLRKLEKLGVSVEVFGQKDLEKLGFGAMLCVSQGSARPPRMVVMRWRGAGKGKGTRPLCVLGKGVTFDTGGISIKPAGGMEDMKWDMAGAAAVAGLMHALAARRSRAEVVGIVGLVENMPSGTAVRPGDVVTSHSGQTVEVINTDAEGRLVLADLLSYARGRFEPAFVVDLATLTGAIIVALGHENAGLFSNDDGLAARIEAAGRAVGEGAWRMPLGEAYDEAIKSPIADMRNVGGRPGGAVTAAQFLKRFVGDTPWAHLDVAGTAWSAKGNPTAAKGATGWGVRLLDRLVAEHHEGRTPAAAPAPEAPPAALAGGGAGPAALAEGTADSVPPAPSPEGASPGPAPPSAAAPESRPSETRSRASRPRPSAPRRR